MRIFVKLCFVVANNMHSVEVRNVCRRLNEKKSRLAFPARLPDSLIQEEYHNASAYGLQYKDALPLKLNCDADKANCDVAHLGQ
jgi:hypothetical protein